MSIYSGDIKVKNRLTDRQTHERTRPWTTDCLVSPAPSIVSLSSTSSSTNFMYASSMCKFRSCYNKCLKLFWGIKSMTVLLRLYLKLDSQALTLCMQMPVLIFTLDGHTVTTPWTCFSSLLFMGHVPEINID